MPNKQFSSDPLFPPVPASYRARMEDVLESLPANQTTIRPLSKKQLPLCCSQPDQMNPPWRSQNRTA